MSNKPEPLPPADDTRQIPAALFRAAVEQADIAISITNPRAII